MTYKILEPNYCLQIYGCRGYFYINNLQTMRWEMIAQCSACIVDKFDKNKNAQKSGKRISGFCRRVLVFLYFNALMFYWS